MRHWLVGVANTAGGAAASSFAYTRRADGQAVRVDEAVRQPDGTAVAGALTYTYDALGRLTKEEYASPAEADSVKEYTLDRVGNRVRVVGATEGQAAVTTTSAYDERDRLRSTTTGTQAVTYGYDNNGAMLLTVGGGEDATYTWDSRGRLAGSAVSKGGATTASSYLYTADGIRGGVTENGSTVTYSVDSLSPSGHAQVVEERAGGLLVASYVYGAGLDPLSTNRDLDGTPASLEGGLYLPDGRSGVRQAVATAGGAVLLVQRFDAFGQTVAKAGPLAAGNPIGYRGERFDPALGQYYLRARFYDPQQGRFTAMDPHRGTYSDPLQSMRYGYARANPVMYADPDGRMAVNATVPGLGFRVSFTLPAISLPKLGLGLSATLFFGFRFAMNQYYESMYPEVYNSREVRYSTEQAVRSKLNACAVIPPGHRVSVGSTWSGNVSDQASTTVNISSQHDPNSIVLLGQRLFDMDHERVEHTVARLASPHNLNHGPRAPTDIAANWVGRFPGYNSPGHIIPSFAGGPGTLGNIYPQTPASNSKQSAYEGSTATLFSSLSANAVVCVMTSLIYTTRPGTMQQFQVPLRSIVGYYAQDGAMTKVDVRTFDNR